MHFSLVLLQVIVALHQLLVQTDAGTSDCLSQEVCSNHGQYTDRVCICEEGFFGISCEMSASDIGNEESCTSETGGVCSNHGTCIGGMCDCNPISPANPSRRYSGQFCECDDYSCDYFNNALCGGPERGTCSCGRCRCRPGYTGTACECPTNPESCRARNGLICNGRGSCRCGICICQDGFYRGPTCEDCPVCPGRCELEKECVLCAVYGSGPMTPIECESKCTNITPVDRLPANDNSWKLCRVRDEDNCYVSFAYNGKEVLVSIIQECPQGAAV